MTANEILSTNWADNANSKMFCFIAPMIKKIKAVQWEQIDFLSNGFRMNDQGVSVKLTVLLISTVHGQEAPASNLYGGSANAF